MKNCHFGHRFSKPKLGGNYGKSEIKIVFVGKEGANDQKESFSIDEPAELAQVRRDNTHYFGTIYTAAYLLSNEKPNCGTIDQQSLMKYNAYSRDFCLTNYFKCAFKTEKQEGKYHGVKNSTLMKKNCAKILLKEIEVLQPDVVVIQGKFAHASFYNEQGLLQSNSCVDEKNFNKISVGCYKRKEDGSLFYIIWSYHPCAYGSKWFKTLPDFRKALDYTLKELGSHKANGMVLLAQQHKKGS